jgi:hypothetical protein
MSERAYEAWIIAAAGEDASRRFDVPEEPGESSMWVRVRPLTAREALQREALGLTERYDLGPDGTPVAMRREYDQAAMVEFELQRCLLDYELPMRVGGDLVPASPELLPRDELLDRLPVRLMEWLMGCLDSVNLRTPEGAEVLAEGKAA